MNETPPTNASVRPLPDQEAQQIDQLFGQYAERLIRLADKHLSRKLAGRVDGEDIVQSVFRTVFRRSTEGSLRIDSSDDLWKLLATITVRKAQARARQHTAAKRDARDESAEGEAHLLAILSREPEPADALDLAVLMENLLHDADEVARKILEHRLAGFTVREIADELGVARMTVQRKINGFKKILHECA